MVKMAILGKSDLLERIAWCKRSADYTAGDEQQKEAQVDLRMNLDVMVATTDPALDSFQLLPKLKPLNFKLPSSDEFELLSSILLKDFAIFASLFKQELVPGRPDYDYGIGFAMETNHIFFEDKIYKMVDVVHEEKKLGGLMSKKTVTKERHIKKMPDLYGKEFDEATFLTILGSEKDNRGNKRFSARVMNNLNVLGRDDLLVDKMPYRWKTPEDFFKNLVKRVALLEIAINRTYTIVGYDESPEFVVMLGTLDADRKIVELKREDVDGVPIIDVSYQ